MPTACSLLPLRHARVATVTCLVSALVLLGAIPAQPALGAPEPAVEPRIGSTAASDARTGSQVRVRGNRWFLSGANLPYLREGCDFGCGVRGGVSGNEQQVRRAFSVLNRNGVRTVRWFVFSGSAWQLGRRGDLPGRITPEVTRDLDAAVRIAAEHDLFLDLVLFPDVAQLPPAWLTDPRGHAAVAGALRPLIRRYARSGRIISWEVVHEPEQAVTAGIASDEDLRGFIATNARMIRGNSRAHAAMTAASVEDLGRWRALGLNWYGVTWLGFPRSGVGCVTCARIEQVRAATGIRAPIVVTSLAAPSGRETFQRMRRLARTGYSGAFVWAVRRVPPPGRTARPRMHGDGVRRFTYGHRGAGPRSRMLNPCFGPQRGRLLCPDLRMSRPFGLYLERRGGRTLLRAGNSIDSIGAGPAEVHGRRTGPLRMRARQQIWRRGGGKLRLPYRGQLAFKFIPGQGRYWKFDNAARFELWRLDGSGRLARLERVGPKAVYCLRDLRRTQGWRRGSPSRMYYPGCSQDAGRQAVTLGTSVGWSDVYPATYHEQWIDVTGLRGCFAYVHIADPKNHIFESNEDNNRATVVVRLPYTGNPGPCARFGSRASQGPSVGTYG